MRFKDAELIARTNGLTPETHFQPTRSDNPHDWFYTVHMQETCYDDEYTMQENEYLNSSLNFVGVCVPIITIQY